MTMVGKIQENHPMAMKQGRLMKRKRSQNMSHECGLGHLEKVRRRLVESHEWSREKSKPAIEYRDQWIRMPILPCTQSQCGYANDDWTACAVNPPRKEPQDLR